MFSSTESLCSYRVEARRTRLSFTHSLHVQVMDGRRASPKPTGLKLNLAQIRKSFSVCVGGNCQMCAPETRPHFPTPKDLAITASETCPLLVARNCDARLTREVEGDTEVSTSPLLEVDRKSVV